MKKETAVYFCFLNYQVIYDVDSGVVQFVSLVLEEPLYLFFNNIIKCMKNLKLIKYVCSNVCKTCYTNNKNEKIQKYYLISTNVMVSHCYFFSCCVSILLYTGLRNPTFRNQEFFVKVQKLISRFFLENQEKN